MGITGAASLREDTMKSIALMFPHAIMRQVQLDEPPQPNNVMRKIDIILCNNCRII